MAEFPKVMIILFIIIIVGIVPTLTFLTQTQKILSLVTILPLIFLFIKK